MKIIFRADASIQIGSGHVMRCLTLADRLRERGATVHFICRELPGHLGGLLVDKGYPVGWLPAPGSDDPAIPTHTAHSAWLGVPWQADAEQPRAMLAGLPEVDWLIVDHYALDRTWEAQMRPLVERIMVIDDLADRPHDCDLLLDQNLYPNLEHRYDNLVPTDCRKLLGPRYALLRPEFGEARKTLRVRDGSIRRILIFFGGSDPTNETTKALEAIRLLDRPDINVDVVVGETNPHKEKVKTLCATLPNVIYHCQVSNMAELMAAADLAIGAGGATTWERCCLGLPSVVCIIADNQVEMTNALANDGCLLSLGWCLSLTAASIGRVIETLNACKGLLQFLGDRTAELVDGHGVERVIRSLSPPISLTLRLAGPADCDNIYHWRNTEETRRFSFQLRVIPLEDHRRWFTATLADPNRILLIGEIRGEPVGVLRYDMDGDKAKVSIYLVPGKQGYGYGPELLEAGHQWIERNHPELQSVLAEVLIINQPSVKAFLEAGFERQRLLFTKRLNTQLNRNLAVG